MTGILSALVHALLNGLTTHERDAVLGDMLELQMPVSRALREVAGLLVRRQAALLVTLRGSLTLAAVVVPLAVLIGLLSRFYAEGGAISAFLYIDNWSPAILDSPGGRKDLVDVVLAQFVGLGTLCVWSWLMGFMIGSLSRATAWVNGSAFAFVLIGEFLAVPQYHHPGNEAASSPPSTACSCPWPSAPAACWGRRFGACGPVPDQRCSARPRPWSSSWSRPY